MLILFSRQIIIIFLLTFLFINNPLIIGFILIVIRMIIRVNMFILSTTPWISYILVIIFLSGIIIIFIYIARLATNEPLKIKFTSISLFIMLRPLILVIYLSYKNNYKNIINLNILRDSKISPRFKLIYKTYRHISNEITIIIIIYLLVVLIAAVKITLTNHLPLRRKI